MDILSTFAELEFRVESSSLTLKNSASGSSFSGPGEIWQDLKGRIFFKAYLNDKAGELSEYCSKTFKVGHIRKKAEYFDLTAQGADGRIWSASQVWPSSRKGLGDDKGLVSGQLREIKCIESYPQTDANWVEMRFRGLLNYPSNITHETTESLDGRLVRRRFEDGAAIVKAKEYEIRFFHHKSHTVVQVKSKSEIPVSMARNITNSLRFCLMSLVECIALKSVAAGQSEATIMLRESAGEKGFLAGSFLPIDLDPSPPADYVSDFWRLFSNYLMHSFNESEKGVATLSELVYAVISSRRVSLFSEALALGTGVEGVGKLSMSKLKTVIKRDEITRPNAIKEYSQFEHAISLINSDLSLDSAMKQRITGGIKGWMSETPIQVVDAFLKSLNLPARLLMSWKKVRHPSAHGSVSNTDSIDTRIQYVNDVRFLFYLIIMAMIEYNGPCVNYSIEGWPVYMLEVWPNLDG